MTRGLPTAILRAASWLAAMWLPAPHPMSAMRICRRANCRWDAWRCY